MQLLHLLQLHLLKLLHFLLRLLPPPKNGGEHDYLNDERDDEKTAGKDDNRLIGPTSDEEAGIHGFPNGSRVRRPFEGQTARRRPRVDGCCRPCHRFHRRIVQLETGVGEERLNGGAG